jgi:hypothetical protein
MHGMSSKLLCLGKDNNFGESSTSFDLALSFWFIKFINCTVHISRHIKICITSLKSGRKKYMTGRNGRRS